MIFVLYGAWAVAIDIIVWLAVHIAVSLYVSRMPVDSFDPESWLYRVRPWERDGETYQKLLRVKAWKRLLPDGAAVSRSGFRKKRLRGSDETYLRTFILETCRAELTHWGIFLFAFVFFVWNEWWIGMIMVAYAVAANMPCIIAQRYNRSRLKRVHYLAAGTSNMISHENRDSASEEHRR
jgi:glycosyl-4,4'-diaponeurosporenoate acyltransferase